MKHGMNKICLHAHKINRLQKCIFKYRKIDTERYYRKKAFKQMHI